MVRHSGGGRAVADVLERRTLLSDAALSWTVRTEAGQATLLVTGTSASDDIRIATTAGGVTLATKAGSSTFVSGEFAMVEVHAGAGDDRVEVTGAVAARLFGDAGSDTLTGGNGNDQLFAGDGGGALVGGGGDDTLVAVGDGKPVALVGGDGNDSFWYTRRKGQTGGDVTAYERRIGALHAMPLTQYKAAKGARTTAVSPGGTAQIDLPDPAVTDRSYVYRDFAGMPLFAPEGPSPNDVDQGQVADCYLLATLSAVAQAMPGTLRQVIADMGDGTYAVRFKRGASEVYVRVDADLPTAGGQPVYAALGAEGSTWVALVEKAYATFRRAGARYASLNYGWMSETLRALGLGSVSYSTFHSADQFLARVQSLLKGDKAVTYAVKYPKGAPLVPFHAYSVDSVIVDESGRLTGLRLRNPWGKDGVGADGADDGYVTITGSQALTSLWGLQASKLSEAGASA